jgi:hypothetical protein
MLRLALAGLVTIAVAGCATAPAPDLTPPPRKVDAKTGLEYGGR